MFRELYYFRVFFLGSLFHRIWITTKILGSSSRRSKFTQGINGLKMIPLLSAIFPWICISGDCYYRRSRDLFQKVYEFCLSFSNVPVPQQCANEVHIPGALTTVSIHVSTFPEENSLPRNMKERQDEKTFGTNLNVSNARENSAVSLPRNAVRRGHAGEDDEGEQVGQGSQGD